MVIAQLIWAFGFAYMQKHKFSREVVQLSVGIAEEVSIGISNEQELVQSENPNPTLKTKTGNNSNYK